LEVAGLIALALNSGSSSLKYGVFDGERELGRGESKGLPKITVEVDVVGHRIVHGGPRLTSPVIIDDSVMSELEAVIPLAALHMPPALKLLAEARRAFPNVKHVACFDTAFHADLPAVARRYPLPDRYSDIRRYGFHGLSYEYVLSVLDRPLPSRIIIAHLGSGSSLVALRDGQSIDTTMGLTPAGGVLMGTRTGDLDPGVLFYLSRKYGLGIGEMEKLVERESGLLGVGGSADVRELLKRDDPKSRLAIEMYAYDVRKAIGAYAAALGGLDLLVFTGGIGAHATVIRDLIVDGVRFLNAKVQIIPTDEERVIAHHALRLVRA
jgi:acetate kinase